MQPTPHPQPKQHTTTNVPQRQLGPQQQRYTHDVAITKWVTYTNGKVESNTRNYGVKSKFDGVALIKSMCQCDLRLAVELWDGTITSLGKWEVHVHAW